MQLSTALLISLLVVGAAACQDEQAGSDSAVSAAKAPAEQVSATARLQNAKGEPVGTATFTESAEGVVVHVDLSNLAPGTHAVHIHETGACEAPDFASAGGHFHPEGNKHGFDNPDGPHAGDLPNVDVDADGKATLATRASLVSLREGAENSLLKAGGTSLVVHAGADDYKTDPAGDSGDRIACGVIERSGG